MRRRASWSEPLCFAGHGAIPTPSPASSFPSLCNFNWKLTNAFWNTVVLLGLLPRLLRDRQRVHRGSEGVSLSFTFYILPFDFRLVILLGFALYFFFFLFTSTGRCAMCFAALFPHARASCRSAMCRWRGAARVLDAPLPLAPCPLPLALPLLAPRYRASASSDPAIRPSCGALALGSSERVNYGGGAVAAGFGDRVCLGGGGF
jgi:hypothetical protein